MKISISGRAMCGSVEISPGDYWVSIQPEAGEMTLSAQGKDLRIKATRRRLQTRAKTISFTFYCGGGKQWSLIATTPKQGEWISMIELEGKLT